MDDVRGVGKTLQVETNIQGVPPPKKKILAQFSLYALTLSNINRFSKWYYCQNLENIFNNTISKDSTTPKMLLHYLVKSLSGANCRSISLMTPLVSGVVRLNVSSSNKADTLNI